MCYYNINQSIPIDITFNGKANMNKEVFNFKQYLMRCLSHALLLLPIKKVIMRVINIALLKIINTCNINIQDFIHVVFIYF